MATLIDVTGRRTTVHLPRPSNPDAVLRKIKKVIGSKDAECVCFDRSKNIVVFASYFAHGEGKPVNPEGRAHYETFREISQRTLPFYYGSMLFCSVAEVDDLAYMYLALHWGKELAAQAVK